MPQLKARCCVLLEQAESIRHELTDAVEMDAAAYEGFMQASRMAKETPEEQAARSKNLEKAILQAAIVPLSVGRKAVQVIELALQAASLGNLNAISDAGTAAALGQAALAGASLNVRTNILSMSDHDQARQFVEEVKGLEKQAEELQKQLKQVLKERGKLEL